MPKTKMATFRRVVSLGIIVLLVNCLVHSLDLPGEEEEKNEDNTNGVRKQVMRQPEDRQEEQKSEFGVSGHSD